MSDWIKLKKQMPPEGKLLVLWCESTYKKGYMYLTAGNYYGDRQLELHYSVLGDESFADYDEKQDQWFSKPGIYEIPHEDDDALIAPIKNVVKWMLPEPPTND